MSIHSDHINLLVYRYLQESGFQHSSFTFAQESGIAQSSVAGLKIPAGALVVHLQRALNYVQAEVNLTEEGFPADVEDLETIEALTLIESVQPEVCEQRRQQLRARLRENALNANSTWGNGEAGGAEPNMDVDLEIAADKVKILKGHTDEVTACTWNPCFELLATASGDATARIWPLAADSDGEPIVLRHFAPEGEDNKDVTTLDWNSAGTLLATGSYDGAARIWTKTGELQNRLTGHSGPVFSLKWNPSGTLLATSSVDCTAVVWDVATGHSRQTFAFHSAPCLDVDWQDDKRFASCSTDKVIFLCQLGSQVPVRNFKGHEDEVNAVKWDSAGKYLASCSDDRTAKVWQEDKDSAVYTLQHSDKIFSLKWSGEQTEAGLLLASASADQTIKLWKMTDGSCLYTLVGHSAAVYSVDFSRDGRFLASGSFDKSILVWSLKDGELAQTYHGGGGVFEVCFSPDGKRLAASFSDHQAAVLQLQDK
eukprot:m.134027 g.134027  ORF g.134027 m.134027 type:complete len:482 (+) comp20117_c0_seq3:68-1513(+)